jgi:hypothetical protein
VSKNVVVRELRRVAVVAATLSILLCGATTMALTFDRELQRVAQALTHKSGKPEVKEELIESFNALGQSQQVWQLLDALVRAASYRRSIPELELFGGRKWTDADVFDHVVQNKKWVKDVVKIHGTPAELGSITVCQTRCPREFGQGAGRGRFRRAMIPLKIGDISVKLIAEYHASATLGLGARLRMGLSTTQKLRGVWGYRMGGKIVERLTTVGR